jgi:AcrR family transcriptional regulator
MQDRKSEILTAGLQVLREEGFAGFTQPRIAARAGLRQSHLTYYFPTRLDLLAGVARAAIDVQLAAIDRMLDTASPDLTANMARGMVQHESTRVLMGMAQAADHEPALRELFRDLTAGILGRMGTLLESLDIPASQANKDIVHALSVGLAVIDLATARSDGEMRTKTALDTLFNLLGRREDCASVVETDRDLTLKKSTDST